MEFHRNDSRVPPFLDILSRTCPDTHIILFSREHEALNQLPASIENQIFGVTSLDSCSELSLKLLLRNSLKVTTLRNSLADERKVLAQVVVTHKATESQLQNAIEKAKTAAEVKRRFLTNMNHEIRTPMNGIIGMTMLLLRTQLGQHQRRYAETVHNSSTSLLSIIDDILDFSRIETGHAQAQHINFNLIRTIGDVVEAHATEARDKGLTLKSKVPTSIPGILRGDPGRIRQVLNHLLKNAINFTPSGHIFVEATLEQTDLEGFQLRISVTDTGIGVSDQHIEHLFESFKQIDSSMARSAGGTGLGLAISSQLVTLMGGSLGVESEENSGSTFWFAIPLRAAPQASKAQVHTHSSLSGLSLFIIDESKAVRNLLREQAESWGMLVETAPDGASALLALKHAASENLIFDLVTLDWRVPDMLGVDLLRKVREDKALHHLEPVMLTAFPQRGHGELLQKEGFSGYLVKPVQADVLYRCFLAVLNRPTDSRSLVTRHTLEEVDFGDDSPDIVKPGFLVVEDLLSNEESISKFVESTNYQTDIAQNEVMALELFEPQKYVAILIDCEPPTGDGYKTAKRIREFDNECTRAVIIGITSTPIHGNQDRHIDCDMDGWLSKPISPAQIDECLAELVKTSSPQTNVPAPMGQRLSNLQRSADVIRVYTEAVKTHLSSLKTALTESNATQCELHARMVKLSSQIIGANRAVTLARDLEQMGATALLSDPEIMLSKLVEEVEQVILQLQVYDVHSPETVIPEPPPRDRFRPLN